MVAGTIDKIEIIRLLQDKMNYNDSQIAKYLGITTKELKKFRLENHIFYRIDDTKNNNYLSLAIKFNNLADDVYFPIEFARITSTSPSTTNMICKMFNIKPTKKAYCVHCGKEVIIKTTAVPKYCSYSCRSKQKGEVKC